MHACGSQANQLACLLSSRPLRVSASKTKGEIPADRIPQLDPILSRKGCSRALSVALGDPIYLALERSVCFAKRICFCLALPLRSLGRRMAS